jgi:DNA-binding GntR family transcriptional regulator
MQMADTYETIRTEIIHGILEPGQRLYEEHLAENMGTSRTPVREALRRLETEGLVEFTRNKGAVVKKYSMEEINNIFSMRVLLEGYAAQQAAWHRNSQHLEEFTVLNDQFKSLFEIVKKNEVLEGYVDRFVEINQNFHRVIWEASNNALLPNTLNRLMVIPLIYKTYDKYNYRQIEKSLTAHQTISQAISHKDAERAEIAMKEHIISGRDQTVSFL